MALLRLSETQLEFLLATLALAEPEDEDISLRDEVHATLAQNLDEIRLASRSPSLAPQTPPRSVQTTRVTRSQASRKASFSSATSTIVNRPSSRDSSVYSEASTLVNRSSSGTSSCLLPKSALHPISEEASPNAVRSKGARTGHSSTSQPTVASSGQVRGGGQNGDPARPSNRSCMRNSTRDRTNPRASRRALEERVNAENNIPPADDDDDYVPEDDDDEDYIDDDAILPAPAPLQTRTNGQKVGWRPVTRYRALTQEASCLLVELIWGIENSMSELDSVVSSLSKIERQYALKFKPPSNSLREAFQKCNDSERAIGVVTFLNFVTFIEFSLWVDLEKKQHRAANPKDPPLPTAAVAKNHKLDVSKFQRYNNKGLKLLIHAHAGTFYLLVLIAAFGLGSHFNLNHPSTAEDTQSMSWTLTRLPEGTPEHYLFVNLLIPCLKRLIEDHPAGSVFFLNVPHADGTHEAVHFSDYAKTDQVLATIAHEGFKLPPRSSFWEECTPLVVSPVPTAVSTAPSQPAPPQSTPQKVVWPHEIKAKGSPTRGMPKPRRQAWTEFHRPLAEQAKTVNDVPELEEYVRDHHFLPDGTRKHDSFINISADMLNGCRKLSILHSSDLLVEDAEGNYGMLYCTQLPSATPERLKRITSTIELLFPGGITKSSSKEEGYTYGTYNFHTLNRFGKSGEDAPRDQHPIDITSASARGDNESQRLPGPTAEMKKHLWAHSLLANALEPIFQDVAAKAFAHLPHQVKQFRGYVDIQPMDRPSPTSPFTGFHLNLRVATDGHVDDNDFGPCAVTTLATFKGGQLVLHELGLVIDLRPGQVLFFPSRSITHYNLHFEGERVSIVLSFDKEALKWVKTANGWRHILASNRPRQDEPGSPDGGPPTKKRKSYHDSVSPYQVHRTAQKHSSFRNARLSSCAKRKNTQPTSRIRPVTESKRPRTLAVPVYLLDLDAAFLVMSLPQSSKRTEGPSDRKTAKRVPPRIVPPRLIRTRSQVKKRRLDAIAVFLEWLNKFRPFQDAYFEDENAANVVHALRLTHSSFEQQVFLPATYVEAASATVVPLVFQKNERGDWVGKGDKSAFDDRGRQGPLVDDGGVDVSEVRYVGQRAPPAATSERERTREEEESGERNGAKGASSKLTQEEVDAGAKTYLEEARRRIKLKADAAEKEKKKKEKAAKDAGNKGKKKVSDAVREAVKNASGKGKGKEAEGKEEKPKGSVPVETIDLTNVPSSDDEGKKAVVKKTPVGAAKAKANEVEKAGAKAAEKKTSVSAAKAKATEVEKARDEMWSAVQEAEDLVEMTKELKQKWEAKGGGDGKVSKVFLACVGIAREAMKTLTVMARDEQERTGLPFSREDAIKMMEEMKVGHLTDKMLDDLDPKRHVRDEKGTSAPPEELEALVRRELSDGQLLMAISVYVERRWMHWFREGEPKERLMRATSLWASRGREMLEEEERARQLDAAGGAEQSSDAVVGKDAEGESEEDRGVEVKEGTKGAGVKTRPPRLEERAMDPACLFDDDIDEVLTASQSAAKMEVGLAVVEKEGWTVAEDKEEEDEEGTSSEGEALGQREDRERHEEEAGARHSGGRGPQEEGEVELAVRGRVGKRPTSGVFEDDVVYDFLVSTSSDVVTFCVMNAMISCCSFDVARGTRS
ncbi:uncharacterized protein STEHIDRAFT_112965 [Stereum hirsutum FP-91666 SS1]|uniref:uncharacterized protein n=1 Tax=Stereum hirsutum (strain FP-91666) TaxID=721885 RepID=UPI000444A222|nr:uncharacterized protein STEHIDRAFT_112965 [Stereum hirsutum FP-91666 SS1]EIM84636.1 hypothetical protein STEHIDRAFT_112965 [Stereum hirsutum FP-91666 SS1]